MSLSTTSRNLICDAVADALDDGYINIKTAAGATLATIPLGTPAFGDASNGEASAINLAPDFAADATGTATKATIHKSDDTQLAELTVSTSGADINLGSVSITLGQEVRLTGFTISCPEE